MQAGGSPSPPAMSPPLQSRVDRLERDDVLRIVISLHFFVLSMISAQTLRACREGKPVPTFPDHAPGPVLRQQDRARFFLFTDRVWFTSPRLRGEVGSHRRCDPGEGDSPRVGLVERGPSSRPSPLKNGAKEKMSVVAARLPVQAPLNTGLRLSMKACTASR